MRGYRVAVVDPLGSFGKRVRDLLQERSFPATELKLFETAPGGDSALSEFQGEVVITQALDPDLFPTLDLIFFGGRDPTAARQYVPAALREGLLAVVSGAAGIEGPVVALGVNGQALPEAGRLVIAPRPASILLGTMLATLGRSFEVRQACATLLVPASEMGEEGVEELHQQTVSILSFRSPATRVFSDQMAFNLMLAPEASPPDVIEEAVAREAALLAGGEPEVTVSVVRAPVFHSYALSLWVRLAEAVEREAVEQALRASRKLDLGKPDKQSKTASPVSVAGSEKIRVGRLRRDSSTAGGFWLWVVADALAVDAAANAVRLAEKLLGISPAKK